MKLASTSLLGIAFALIFALPGKAAEPPVEKPFTVDLAWHIGNNDLLVNLVSHITGAGDVARQSLGFPEEIRPDASWGMARITDGNDIWTIIKLPLREANTQRGLFSIVRPPATSDLMLKTQLQANVIIAGTFSGGEFQMERIGTSLFLMPSDLPDIPDTDVKALFREKLLNEWVELEKFTIAFVQYYPERTLLPILPPEQENESAFVKLVRARYAYNYQDGQFVGDIASTLAGLEFTSHNVRIVLESTGIEGTEDASDVELLPFQFGGFVNPEATVGAAFRIPDWRIATGNIMISGGFRIIPPEQRKNDRKRSFYIGLVNVLGRSNEVPGRSGYHLISDGNTHVFYPRQPENRPEEDGLLSNEEMDDVNKKLARGLFTIVNEFRALDWSQPVDIAFSIEDGIGYLACSHPSDIAKFDWVFIENFMQVANDSVQAVNPEFSLENMFGALRMEIIGEPEMIAEVVYRRITFLFTDAEGGEHRILTIVGHEPERVYAAIILPSEETSEERLSEQREVMPQRFAQMIIDSKQGIAEKMKPPITILHSRVEGINFRVNYETIGTGFRFTARVANDSFGNVLALARNFAGNYLNEALPFMRMFE